MTTAIPFPETAPPRWSSDRHRNWRLRWREEVAGLVQHDAGLDPEVFKTLGRYQPIATGRGQAGILTLPGLPPLFHRHALRGGHFLKYMGDRYLRLFAQPRPLVEADIAQQVRAAGIRTPAVVALRYSTGHLYRYDLYQEAILGARDGLDLWQNLDETALAIVMAEAGRLIARLQTTGFLHPDLNFRNLLFRGGVEGGLEGWIVDLDRVQPCHQAARHARSLSRLRRHLKKYGGQEDEVAERLWEVMLEHYVTVGGVVAGQDLPRWR